MVVACPSNFTYVQSVRGCYYVVLDLLVEYNAARRCISLHPDAHLVVITSVLEQTFMDSLLYPNLGEYSSTFALFVFFSSFDPFVFTRRLPTTALHGWTSSTDSCLLTHFTAWQILFPFFLFVIFSIFYSTFQWSATMPKLLLLGTWTCTNTSTTWTLATCCITNYTHRDHHHHIYFTVTRKAKNPLSICTCNPAMFEVTS